MSIFFTCNDIIYPAGSGVIAADNRSFRYGDGLFETIKVDKGIVQLSDLHFQRLFAGMQLLQFITPVHFTKNFFEKKILELCIKNHHECARVRIMIYRGNGGLFETGDPPGYVIQTWNDEPLPAVDPGGIQLDLYTGLRKYCDAFANLKTNNFLVYVMAALHAKSILADDCLVLNNHERISDTSIANIFIIKDNIMFTPSLEEGCIAGVMRKFLIELLRTSGYTVIERPLSINDLETADEVFLTNSIKGIKWVKQFGSIEYSHHLVKDFYQLLLINL